VRPAAHPTALLAERLAAAGCVAADEEAGELVATASDEDELERWVRRRETGEPLAWIVGQSRFCGRRVWVDPGVYVPRAQSEELARRAARLLRLRPGRAADLCTGSGAIAQHLMAEVPGAVVVGVDADRRAVSCARRNGVAVVQGDMGGPLRRRAFDVVTAVAPYVPTGDVRYLPGDVQRWEPPAALDGGPDGLDVVRHVLADAARLLRPGGWLLLELGGDQDRALVAVWGDHGFEADGVVTWRDEDGDLRGVAARSSPSWVSSVEP